MIQYPPPPTSHLQFVLLGFRHDPAGPAVPPMAMLLVILIMGLLSKYAKANYFEKKSCFKQKNVWSRFALILFKLHEIWYVNSQENH